MINFHYLQPVLPVSGEVVTSGHFGDLKAKAGAVSVGLYNATNTPSQYYIATGTGNADRFFIGNSSPATKDSLDKWHFGRTNPIKSHEFRGKDIISFEYANPTRLQKEVWHVGYTGVAGCNEKPFSFECGKTYGMMISLGGSPTFRQWAKTLRHEIYVTTPCCDSDECTTGCADSAFDCEYVYKEFAKKINEHVELSLMGIKARYITSTYAATAPTHFDYCLSICDGGSPLDLAAVQAVVTEGKVARTGRKGGISTYQVTCVAAAPAPFTPTSDVLLADCGVCAPNYTLVPATDVYVVVRPLAGTEDLTSPATQLAYATSVASAYSGTSPMFLSQNGATASIQFEVPTGTAATALLADAVIKGITKEARCTPRANTPVAWTQCGEHYKVQRDLCMTLPRKECGGADYLAEVTAMLQADPTYVAGSVAMVAGQDCADKYTAKQWSNCMDDACLSKDTASYDRILQGFANEDVIGVWEVVEDTAPVYDADKKCGLEISAETSERYLSDCVSQLNDFYETEPIRMEVNWIQNQLTGLPDACATKAMPKAQRTQLPAYASGTGEWFLREYIKQNAYTMMGCEETDPKMREVLDQNLRPQVDRQAFYKIYYIKYRADKGNTFGFDKKGEFCEAMIGFKEGEQAKAAAFEAAFGNVFSKFNVFLKKRK